MSEVESVQETGPSTAVEATRQISAAALINAGAQAALQAGARPTFGSPSLRSDMITRAPLMYDGANLTKLEGYDVHGASLGGAVAALDGLKSVIESVIAARNKSTKDPELQHSVPAQVLRVADYADKISDAATRKLDTAHRAVTAEIASVEAELTRTVQSGTQSALASEVRSFCRSHKSPVSFVGELIASGDSVSVSAVLGAPSYLSGLTEQMRSALIRQWNARQNPALNAKLQLLTAAQERLERAGSAFVNTLERAQGVTYPVIKKLRDAKAAASFG